MSLKRKSVGGTPGNSRVRQPFKSPFRTPGSPVPTEGGNITPTSKRAGTNKLCGNSNISLKYCNEGNGDQTRTLPDHETPSKKITLNYSTPQKLDTGQSPVLKDCRRKVFPRNFSVPFRSPSNNNLIQQSTTPEEQLAQLGKQEADLDNEISSLQDSGYKTEELQYHIDNLHQYNEIKDAAQLVLGRLAEMEEVTVKEMHEKYDVSTGE